MKRRQLALALLCAFAGCGRRTDDPKPVDYDFSIISEAILKDDTEGFRTLLATGFSAEALNNREFDIASEKSPIHVAAKSGNVAALTLLLDRGVKVDLLARSNATSVGGGPAIETPLVLASQAGRLEVAKFLLERGAAVDAVPGRYNQIGPLMAAADAGQLAVVKLLCEQHATIDRDPLETGPLFRAAAAGHKEVVQYLLLRHARVTEEAARRVESTQPEIFRMLIRAVPPAPPDPFLTYTTLLNRFNRKSDECNRLGKEDNPEFVTCLQQLQPLMNQMNQLKLGTPPPPPARR